MTDDRPADAGDVDVRAVTVRAIPEAPEVRWTMGVVRRDARGAPQVLRGPADGSRWIRCCWPETVEDPGGLVIERRECTTGTLPMWVVEAIQHGAYPQAWGALAGRGDHPTRLGGPDRGGRRAGGEP